MLSVSGDVVVQSLSLIIVALVGAWGGVAAARRSKRAEQTTKRAEEVTGEVAAQLRPNGGSSLRDAVDRLDRRTTAHDERMGRIEDKLDHLIDRTIR